MEFWHDSDTESVKRVVAFFHLAELWPVYLAAVIIVVAATHALSPSATARPRRRVGSRSEFWPATGFVSLIFLIIAGTLRLAGVRLMERVKVPPGVAGFLGLFVAVTLVVALARQKSFRLRALRFVELLFSFMAAPFMRGPRVYALDADGGRTMPKDDPGGFADAGRTPTSADVAAAAKSPATAWLMRLVLERQQGLVRQQIESLKLYKTGAQELIEVRRRQQELVGLEEQLRREAEISDLAHQREVLSEELEIARLKEAKRKLEDDRQTPKPRARPDLTPREKDMKRFFEGLGDEQFWQEVAGKFSDDPVALDLIDRIRADRRQEEF